MRNIISWLIERWKITVPVGAILVAVGARGARAKIRQFMADAGRQEGGDYLFVV